MQAALIFCKDFVLRDGITQIEQEVQQYLDQIEIEIVKSLYKVFQGGWRQEHVIEALKRLTPADCEARSEYLCDVVWLKKKPLSPDLAWVRSSTVFESIRMACECERSGKHDEVLKDFMKLPLVAADLKVFIHINRSTAPEKGIDSVPKFINAICPIRLGDRYLLIGSDESHPYNLNIGLIN
jgi:hypothetical protein